MFKSTRLRRGFCFITAGALPALVGLGLAKVLPGPGTEATHHEAAAPAGTPRVQVDQTELAFGLMDVGEQRSHTFLVKNTGDAPLTLQEAGTSCECTLLDLRDGQVAPGGEGRVRLSWRASEPADVFRHGALIRTNDPDRPALDLTVSGQVRTHLGLWPKQIVFSDVLPGEERTAQAIVYSQVWDDFEIYDSRCSLSHLRWRVLPAEETQLDLLQARSAKVVEVTLPAGLPRSAINARLTLRIRLPGEPVEPQQSPCELAILGNVCGYYLFFGRIIDEGGTLDLGTVKRQRGARYSVTMQVRGQHRDVKILEIRSQPEFLKVEVQDAAGAGPGLGRFEIVLEVPAGSPVANWRSPRPAQIEIVTDHPESPKITLPVQFCVMEAG
jgi:hypothetical protein